MHKRLAILLTTLPVVLLVGLSLLTLLLSNGFQRTPPTSDPQEHASDRAGLGGAPVSSANTGSAPQVAGRGEVESETQNGSTTIDGVLAAGMEAIEDFLTINGKSFNVHGAAELLSDENFPKLVTAMSIGSRPIKLGNTELALQNILYSQPLANTGEVVPQSTNCGRGFCVASVTSSNEDSLQEYLSRIQESDFSSLPMYSSITIISETQHSIEGRLIFSTDPSLNSMTIFGAGSDD